MVWGVRLQYRHWLLPINPLLRTYRLCDVCLELRLLRLLLRSQVSSLLLVVPFLFGDDFHCLAEGVDGYLDDYVFFFWFTAEESDHIKEYSPKQQLSHANSLLYPSYLQFRGGWSVS